MVRWLPYTGAAAAVRGDMAVSTRAIAPNPRPVARPACRTCRRVIAWPGGCLSSLGVGMLHLLLFIQPESVKAHDVVNAKVVVRIMALNVGKPAVVDLFPGYRQQGWVLLKDRLGLPDQVFALGGVQFAVDLQQ